MYNISLAYWHDLERERMKTRNEEVWKAFLNSVSNVFGKMFSHLYLSSLLRTRKLTTANPHASRKWIKNPFVKCCFEFHKEVACSHCMTLQSITRVWSCVSISLAKLKINKQPLQDLSRFSESRFPWGESKWLQIIEMEGRQRDGWRILRAYTRQAQKAQLPSC